MARNTKKELLGDVSLIVAGRNPDDEMVELCGKTKKCTLVDSPEDIAPFFQGAALYIAPIFSGAGMKVKVAEALSYGLRVIGTSHALIGYEEARCFCCTANDADAFEKAILRYIGEDTEENRSACKEMYERLYALERSCKDFGRAITKMYGEEKR